MSQPIQALIIDDVAAVRSFISQILRQLGITRVAEAADGNSAQQAFDYYRPQLVFLDIQLPDINGKVLLKQFKKQNACAVIFIISAFSSVENLKEAMENGAKAFVVKPFRAERINSLVQPLLQ